MSERREASDSVSGPARHAHPGPGCLNTWISKAPPPTVKIPDPVHRCNAGSVAGKPYAGITAGGTAPPNVIPPALDQAANLPGQTERKPEVRIPDPRSCRRRNGHDFRPPDRMHITPPPPTAPDHALTGEKAAPGRCIPIPVPAVQAGFHGPIHHVILVKT